MELVVRKSDLLRELQLLHGIVERKTTIPILANILVEARGEEVRLQATDMDLSLQTTCPASVSRAGRVTLPARKLYELVKEFPEADVRVEQAQQNVRIAVERFESRLATLPPDDFPAIPQPVEPYDEVVPAAGLRLMIGKTAFATTAEDTRYYLHGALLVLGPGSVSMVATDGHRLALATVPRGAGASGGAPPAGSAEDRRVLIPKKTLSELDRLLAEDGADLRFGSSESHLFFEVGARVLGSRKHDGQFPAYDRVIPRNNDKRVVFDRIPFLKAVRLVALLSSERARAVRFQVSPGQVEVTANSPEVGEARDILAVEYDGPPVQICFNALYVLDFLNAVETERVTLEFRDEVSQAVMRPLAPEGYDYQYVIMPMRP